MKFPEYFYFRVHVKDKGTAVEIEDASDVDVAEVVRCKDCRYCYVDDLLGVMECQLSDALVEPNAYCSDGRTER